MKITEIYVLRECGSISLYKDGIELIDQYFFDYPKTPEHYEREAKFWRREAESYQEDAKFCGNDTEYYLKKAGKCVKRASYYQDLANRSEPDWRTWCLAELEYYKKKLQPR